MLLISDFHPYVTLRNWKRTFFHKESKRTYAVKNHVHLFEHYFRYLNELGFQIEDLVEPLYEGFPLVFVLKARKK